MNQSDRHNTHESPLEHPAQLPAEPDHPMELNGCLVPGDPALMLRIQLEEYMMTGTPLHELRRMMNEPQYQSLYGAAKAIGHEKATATFNRLAAAVGSLRCTLTEYQGQSDAVDLTINATGHTPISME